MSPTSYQTAPPRVVGERQHSPPRRLRQPQGGRKTTGVVPAALEPGDAPWRMVLACVTRALAWTDLSWYSPRFPAERAWSAWENRVCAWSSSAWACWAAVPVVVGGATPGGGSPWVGGSCWVGTVWPNSAASASVSVSSITTWSPNVAMTLVSWGSRRASFSDTT